MNEYVKSDLYRLYGDCSWKSFVKAYLKHTGFRYMVAFRLTNSEGGQHMFLERPYGFSGIEIVYRFRFLRKSAMVSISGMMDQS